ncbi:MAG TPA: A/G-specific adenine glycosylase [Patescibacteria group bacterium]|nr:A/G-specific adenine glycosylase [Patescibacteria group bacterium]
MHITSSKIGRVHRKLVAWFHIHGRRLPWRETDDPYAILVSELMLQQTQVSRVLPKYKEFLKKYSTKEALGSASLSDVFSMWSGLGYNRRAKYLWQIARKTAHKDFPKTFSGLTDLPGVGENTACAVLSFAYHKPYPILDVNAKRVLSRLFFGEETTTIKTSWFRFAKTMLPKETKRQYGWNQALMDLGALVCVQKSPLCRRCPLLSECVFGKTFVSGETKTTPLKKKKHVPFSESRRFVRGQIVKILLHHRRGAFLHQTEIAKRITLTQKQKEEFFFILETLVDEGMLERSSKDVSFYRLPSSN